ncbi:MAG: hypothetical protein U0939_25365 [Pirellulales bacterium]
MVMNPDELRQAGDWIAQLKKILQLGDDQNRDYGQTPKSEHRSTKTAVKLLLSNLKKGSKKTRDQQTTDKDLDLVVFNAVDKLIRDKEEKSKKGKSTLDAVDKFRQVFLQEFASQSHKKNPLDDNWKDRVESSLRALRSEGLADIISAGTEKPEDLKTHRTDLISTDEGKKLLATRRELAENVLSEISADELNGLDLDGIFGDEKPTVVAGALLRLAKNETSAFANFDPQLFVDLARNVPVDDWNNQTATDGPLKGLGARVCQALWRNQNYDQICSLIDLGVDTSLATRVDDKDGKGGGVYSGFIQPIQHVTSKLLRQVPRFDNGEQLPGWTMKKQVQGAKKVLAALERNNVSETLTKWQDVENSEMIKEFKKNPGTIWGFEDIRLPYVQAAHETDEGAQPLRMMELWEAIDFSLNPDMYEQLVDDPESVVDQIVALGVIELEKGFKSTEVKHQLKFGDIKNVKDEFIAQFKKDAASFLREFSKQLPKGAYADVVLDENDEPEKRGDATLRLSDLAGIVPDKFLGGIACKAGLWWAKTEGKPVYYCLDGIHMEDVVNYKKVKNKAIEDFLSKGGVEGGAKGHDEVITLVEMREILKNWDDFKDTVKFVDKGKILKERELQEWVDKWRKALLKANKKAGRAPAPDKNVYARQLNAIHPKLLERIEVSDKGNMDARDIVRKHGYLVKVANTRPHIVLKYIISKCGVLEEYKLIPAGLSDAAREFSNADDLTREEAAKKLAKQIKKCHKDYREPLTKSLLPKK